MKNSQALENLKQSARKQEKELTNTIAEIHAEKLRTISKNLENLHSTKLEKMNEDIQELISESMNLNLKLIVSLTAIFFLTIGILGTWYLMKDWRVPTELQVEDKQGKYIKSKKYTYHKETDTVYIKIGD